MTSDAQNLLPDEKSFPTLRAANQARQIEWDAGNQITLAYRGNELAGEVGEACNVIKKLERERLGIAGSRDTTEHLAEELADVVICADLIATQAGIDLDAAVEAKFNATSSKVGLATRYRRRSDSAVERVVEAARQVLASWDNRMPDGPELLKPGNEDIPPYWSPSASMVESRHVSALRSALRDLRPNHEVK